MPTAPARLCLVSETLCGAVVWSIGHSTHALDDWVALLRAHEIACVADIRRVPRSRRHPHFATDALAVSLPDAGIAYRALESHCGWRAAGYYASYGA